MKHGSTLPWQIKDKVKVAHLIAAPVQHEFTKGLTAECWGYNGSTPGPTLAEEAWQRCLDVLPETFPDYLVLSGGLPPGGLLMFSPSTVKRDSTPRPPWIGKIAKTGPVLALFKFVCSPGTMVSRWL